MGLGLLCHPDDPERVGLVLRALGHTPQWHVSVPSGQTWGLVLGGREAPQYDVVPTQSLPGAHVTGGGMRKQETEAPGGEAAVSLQKDQRGVTGSGGRCSEEPLAACRFLGGLAGR